MAVKNQVKQDKQVNQDKRDEREVTIEARYLMAAAECCAKGIDKHISPTLGCVHIRTAGGRVHVESTDTYKLVRITREADGDDGIDLAIVAQDMKPVLKAKNRVRIGGYSEALGTVELRVVGERTSVTARVVEGNYPNFENLLKADGRQAETYMPLLNPAYLADVCKAAGKAFNDTGMRFTVGGFREPVRFRCEDSSATMEGLLMPLRDGKPKPEAKPEPEPEPKPEPKSDTAKPNTAKPNTAKPKAAKPKAKAASKATPKAVRKVSAAKPKPKPKPKAQAPTFGWLDRPCA